MEGYFRGQDHRRALWPEAGCEGCSPGSEGLAGGRAADVLQHRQRLSGFRVTENGATCLHGILLQIATLSGVAPENRAHSKSRQLTTVTPMTVHSFQGSRPRPRSC